MPLSKTEQTYLALLLLPHNSLRLKLQPELAACRDAVAMGQDATEEETQDAWEAKAVRALKLINAVLADN